MIISDITYLFLQQYWWFLVSLLAALLVFLLFVQGGQTLIYRIGKVEAERKMLVNTLGRKWEITYTTLVTFGGAFFASFPLFYATSFGGAYWLWIAILFSFTILAISYEFRGKAGNLFGKVFYESLMFINGLFGTFLLGVVVGTFFTGNEFSLNMMNNVSWHNPARGLEAIINIDNVLLGLSFFFLARLSGLLYFMLTIHDDNIFKRSKKHLLINTIPFLVFFLSFLFRILIKTGYAVAENGEVFLQDYKYLHNFLEMPIVSSIFLIGVVLVLSSIVIPLFIKKDFEKGFWLISAGTVLTALALLLMVGYNNTAYYPSTYDINSSLTIINSSSSFFTLKVMSIVSFIIPIVVGYIAYAWNQINKNKITHDEMNDKDMISY